MKTDNDLTDYPYMQVIILFAGIGSAVGGLTCPAGSIAYL